MDPLLWVALFIGAGALFGGKSDDSPVLTPERDNLYRSLVRGKEPPETLREAADQFESVGLKVQAKILRARAASREMTPEQYEARKAVLRAAFEGNDATAILEFADACEQEGLTRIAGSLRQKAEALKAGKVTA